MAGCKSTGFGYVAGVFLLVTAIFALEPICAEAKEPKRVGLLLFSEEKRYVAWGKCAVEQLAKEGFKEPGVKFYIDNAKGSKAKAAELARADQNST